MSHRHTYSASNQQRAQEADR
ncbi:hypothetical protein ANANG_G00181960 [Anguilla anguilla]|uniref:Uncharacterized protein n=1 Tax=Anguilla anguilla TaxID=7936 RepID=A0A9D3RTX3_ANGAN|nr:hypothetical protein ANANG_G00181960 [Anguilla anguilla]